jgi:PAS domain S-box-containing protein
VRARYFDLYDLAPVGYCTINKNGLIREANLTVANLLGVARSVLVKRPFTRFIFKEDQDLYYRHRKPLFETGAPQVCELRMVKKDGTSFWARLEATATQDADGVSICRAIVSDITLHKQAEEALRSQAERLRNLHKTDQAIMMAIESPEAIAQMALQNLCGLLHCQRSSVGIFDPEKKYVHVFVAEVKGDTIVIKDKVLAKEAYGDLEILRQGTMEIIEDMSRVTSPSATTSVFRAEGIRSSINVPLFSARGLYGALNVGWEDPRTIDQEEKEIASEVASQIAIAIEQNRLQQETRRYSVELEEQVQERTAKLEAANKELDAFSYSVSHDLRAPLRAVDGFSRILLEEYQSELSPDAQNYLNLVRSNTVQMGRLIDDLLTFSRTSRQALAKRDVDTAEIVCQVLEELHGELVGRKVEVIVGALLHCQADPAMLKQVFFNLISNAVKFTRKKKEAQVEICSINNKGITTYFVKDNGVGFDMRYYGKLFGVFSRLHSESDYEGTGVGLALVQRIVHRHKGRVWAEAEVDKGATFYFTLVGDESG